MSRDDAPNFRHTLAKSCYTCRHYDLGFCCKYEIELNVLGFDESEAICDNHSLKEVICPTCQGRGKICP